MSQLPITVHFCDTNHRMYGSETYKKLVLDSRFHVERWICLSANADNCGVRCRTYCNSSPYAVVGDKATGVEIAGTIHDELLERLLKQLL